MNPVCTLFRRHLARHAALEEALPPGSHLTRHVATCPVCRAAWHDLRALAGDLPTALAAPAASAAFTDQVWARVQSASATPAAAEHHDPGVWRQRPVLAVGAAVATVGILALAGRTLLPGNSSGSGGLTSLPGNQMASQPRQPDAPVSTVPVTATGDQKAASPGQGRATQPGGEGLAGVRPSGRLSGPRALPAAASRLHSGNRANAPSANRLAAPPSLPGKGDGGLGPSGDLAFLNADPVTELRPWAPLPRQEWSRVEEELRQRVRVRDDFVQIPLPRVAMAADPRSFPVEDRSPRRPYPRLPSAPDRTIVAVAEQYRKEAAIVDARLFKEVSVAARATAFSDLCEQLKGDTGIALTAGRSVADEKVTVFCQKQPLRDLMRQLSRPFGYTWLRSGSPGEYRYELVQDLKSQLLEEELRNRDRHEALLALDQEMSQYRAYFSMSPDEALAKAKTAPPEEKQRLERYANTGWGPSQMYYRLARQDMDRLRAGQRVTFSVGPAEEEQTLPPELARGVLQSLRGARVRREGDQFSFGEATDGAEGQAPVAVPDLRPKVTLELEMSDLGQFSLTGGTGLNASSVPGVSGHWLQEHTLAVGVSPTVQNPRNGVSTARFTRDPALQPRVTVAPPGQEVRAMAVGERGSISYTPTRKATSADVLEAFHRATGLPVVSDYYTRLYQPAAVSTRNQTAYQALNQLCDTMRLRWKKEGDWLQFRSTSFFHDRLKEVPNRLLSRWSASRKEHGALTLEDLLEISGLSDPQLDAGSMAEGARELYGLVEWDLARKSSLRPHFRFLGQLTRAQRQEALSPAGLPFRHMLLSQQQQFITLAFGADASKLRSLDELAQATVRIDYSLPGAFEWRRPQAPTAPFGPPSFQPPPVRQRTREAALEAAQRLDATVTDTQIVPTEMRMTIEYSPGPDSRYRPAGIRAGVTRTTNSIGLVPKGEQ
jgi:hypothetical protein